MPLSRTLASAEGHKISRKQNSGGGGGGKGLIFSCISILIMIRFNAVIIVILINVITISIITTIVSVSQLNRAEFENLSEEMRLKLEGFRPGLYVRVEVDSVPCEFVQYFNPCAPLVIGGLTNMEENVGYVQVSHFRECGVCAGQSL